MNEEKNKATFNLQWHITKRCDMDCSICYIPSALKKKIDPNDLTLEESLNVIDDFKQFSLKNGFKPNIIFTGGHPLLSNKFVKLLTYSASNDIQTMVLGNPTHLNDNIVKTMIDCDVSSYQISFDGMEKKHDAIRGKGAFIKATNGVEKLSNNDIKVVVMSTVTKDNAPDMIKLPKYVLDHGATKFDFARLVPTGNGESMRNLMFQPLEYKHFLGEMFETYKGLVQKGYPQEAFGIKDNLWKLFFYEKRMYTPANKEKGIVMDGCSVGASGFCMDSDGSLYGCRRIDDIIDNIRETTVEDFFLNNKTMNEYRQIEKMTACSSCELLYDCRGCPAVAKNYSGKFTDKDPQCWKE